MAECRQWKKHGQKLMQYKGYGWKQKYKVVIAQSGKLDVKRKKEIYPSAI